MEDAEFSFLQLQFQLHKIKLNAIASTRIKKIQDKINKKNKRNRNQMYEILSIAKK